MSLRMSSMSCLFDNLITSATDVLLSLANNKFIFWSTIEQLDGNFAYKSKYPEVKLNSCEHLHKWIIRILKNLYRLYDNLNRSNLLMINRTAYEKMRKDPKYTDLGTIGSIAPEEDPICPEFPLQRVNYYLTDELLLKVRLSEGYENKGIIGYAAPGFGDSDAFTRI
ncbi:hypothetical protein T11_7434 [Trichinella zimbabwensis]|uniref:Uncharacterized protein n=1 Tax=Trichinella zimbabwensis TaxID=268475 RepID=A0A0V1GVC6_9BILA|nr:hypothetical protein T11_7434 [Trichinella zimbabwensis]